MINFLIEAYMNGNFIIYFIVTAGLVFAAAGITLMIIGGILSKNNALGDTTPTIEDYSTHTFASSYFGSDYGSFSANTKKQ